MLNRQARYDREPEMSVTAVFVLAVAVSAIPPGNGKHSSSAGRSAREGDDPLDLEAAAAGYSPVHPDLGFAPGQQDAKGMPFEFNYNVQDEQGTGLFHESKGDESGTVRGSYGYTDAQGLYRTVKYVADANGFRAEVKSNEPGLKAEDPADAKFDVEPSPAGLQSAAPKFSAAKPSFKPSAQPGGGKAAFGPVSKGPARAKPGYGTAPVPSAVFPVPF
ncbi:cuticle protein 6-like [Ornithodoros turicata]|uniref:cuticle protein 6-like n=1 Tax=Ornithodoros turicata TaxID=34597 RepID=UPI003139838D